MVHDRSQPSPDFPLPIDPKLAASDLVRGILEGTKTLVDVRHELLAIKHPGIRLKVQFEFRQQLKTKLGFWRGIDNWGDYSQSLKKLKNHFVSEKEEQQDS